MIIRLIKFTSVPEPEQFNQLLSLLNCELTSEVSRFKRSEDRYRSFLARILIYDTLAEVTGKIFADINIKRTEHNRPELSPATSTDFNISHSGNFVVIAVSENRTGIDIEQTDPTITSEIKKFYSEEEQKYILSNPMHKRDAETFRIWTLKESFLKADGRGFHRPPESFTVTPLTTPEGYSFRSYDTIPGYVIAVAVNSENRNFPDNLTIEMDSELIESFIEKLNTVNHYKKTESIE